MNLRSLLPAALLVVLSGAAASLQTPESGIGGTEWDATRLVRIWDVRGRRPQEDPYSRAREAGERMILATRIPADGRAVELLASAGFSLFVSAPGPVLLMDDALVSLGAARRELPFAEVVRRGLDVGHTPQLGFPPPPQRDRMPATPVECLEHGQPAPFYSPWDPQFGRHTGRHLRLLAEASRGPETKPSTLLLSVQGDHESTGTGLGPEAPAGEPHSFHAGWWCGGHAAIKDFREAMLRKYGSPEALNTAWNSQIRTLDEIAFPRAPQEGRRRWLDFVEWYIHRVTAMADVPAKVARREFPETRLALPYGPDDARPVAGADNVLLAKIAARYGAAVRTVQGADRPFAEQQAGLLGLTAAACRFYGTPLWLEGGQKTDADALQARVTAAASTGASSLIQDPGPAIASLDAHYRLGRHLRYSAPEVDVAMFFPTTTHRLRGGRGLPPLFRRGCSEVRDLLNYEVLDEPLIREGALSRYRILVIWEGTIVEADTLARIREWVAGGGVVAAYDFGRIETVEGDKTWFQELFGHAGALRPPVLTRRYAGTPPPERYRIRTGEENADRFLSGEWQDPEIINSQTGRWTGAMAEIRLPVTPSKPFRLTIRALVPPEVAGYRRDVLVNGRRLGLVDSISPTTTILVPGAVVGTRPLVLVSIQSQTWSPNQQIPNNPDSRMVGTFVTELQVDPVEGQIAVDSPDLPGRIEAAIDPEKLKHEWAKPVGRGWAVYYPGPRRLISGYLEVIRFLTHRLTELDRSKRDAIPADDAWDGVYAAYSPDRILYYNPTAQPITRAIPLKHPALARRIDARSYPGGGIVIPAGGLSAVPLSASHPEMLLQCEKFIDAGALKPSEGDSYSPGRGPTHVLIPTGGRLATRFQCDVAGRYTVYYRATRRGRPARADIEINGRKPGGSVSSTGWRAESGTLRAGVVDLRTGVHSLVIRPLTAQDLRADYVILTTDPAIAGYTYALRP